MTEQNDEMLHFVNYFRNKAGELELQNIDLQLKVQRLTEEVESLREEAPSEGAD